MDAAASIRIAGLTPLDELELAKQFPPGSVTFEEEALSGAKHGEPMTLFLVATVTSATLGVLAAWLMKDTTSDRIKKRVETTDAKGRKRVETLDINLRTSKSPKTDVLKALAKLCRVDLGALEKAADK